MFKIHDFKEAEVQTENLESRKSYYPAQARYATRPRVKRKRSKFQNNSGKE